MSACLRSGGDLVAFASQMILRPNFRRIFEFDSAKRRTRETTGGRPELPIAGDMGKNSERNLLFIRQSDQERMLGS